ncbi:MAG: hypothetical protein KC416_07210 [Myxococcales bacterium]|nr:hypothetical protein [Myxococcales bacterium]
MSRFSIVCLFLGAIVFLPAGGCGTDGASPRNGDPATMLLPDGAVDPGENPGGGCDCPSLPDTCTPPTDAIAFSPASDEYNALFANAIACAETSLDVAIYETEWPCLVELFAERLKAAPGLRLNVVIDDEECPPAAGASLSCAWTALEDHPQVTIVTDDRGALMHNKFMIVDNDWVWTGSGNFTERSFCGDFNNAHSLTNKGLVAAFRGIFDRFFTARDFGPIPNFTPTTAGNYTFYVSPESPLSKPSQWLTAQLAAIDASTTSIDFMIFAFTRTDISDALLAAKARGVTVRGIVAAQYTGETPVKDLVKGGVSVRVEEVHHKAMIIDGKTLITGSANWSANAQENNEVSLWSTDPTALAAYQGAFDNTYALAGQ